MTQLEFTLLLMLIIAVLAAVALGLKAHNWKKLVTQWQETANLYSNMYAESAEILADLVVNGEDFGEK